MPWVKLTVTVTQARLEETEEALLDHNAQSITVTSAEHETFLEKTLHELPRWAHVQVEALFLLSYDIRQVQTTLRRLDLKILDISFVGDDWQSMSVPRGPLDFSGLRVVPRSDPVSDLTNTVRLEPGLGFGTGEHPTTSMCLTWLANNPLQGLNVLDFGTGSGILAIAAKKLGAQQVDAVDIDPLALQTARDNARYNDVEISVMEQLSPTRRYDLIVANILLNTIVEFASILTTQLNPGGVILLTGLLPSQIEQVKSTYVGVNFDAVYHREEWRLLVGKKNSNQSIGIQ